jgi:nucleoside-triphosphatase THEP1
MFAISDEQNTVLQHIKAGHNVIVDAVAGSGKSTTILSIAKAMPTKKFIQFTYNSMLRHEIKEKANSLGLHNIDIHTYHSLAVKYYNPSAHTDSAIRAILNAPARIHIPKKDVIVIDEAQDMTFLYFAFVIKYAFAMKQPFQLMVLGDFMQGLYDFKGADTRFLTLASQIWDTFPQLKTNTFHYCTLKTSYRITNQMAAFINNAMLAETRLLACRQGNINVTYVRNHQRNLENFVIFTINQLLRTCSPDDIFILGASVKGTNSSIRKMENALVSNGISCFVPSFETDNVDDKVIRNKIVFSTFHSVKGRQRKYVFVLGFDQGYMRFYGKHLQQDICPSTLYVACTRATEGLFLLERNDFNTDRPLDFLKLSPFDIQKLPYVDFKGSPFYAPFGIQDDNNSSAKNETQKHYITPTNLIKFVSETVLETICPVVNTMFKTIVEKGVELDIPNIIETDASIFEDVSDLNGIAIPAMYYDILGSNNANVLQDYINMSLETFRHNEHVFLQNMAEKIPATCITPSDYLFLANVFIAFQEKLYFKLKQIPQDKHNWLSDTHIAHCKRRLHTTIGADASAIIEKTIIHQSMDLEHNTLDILLSEYFDDSIKFRFTARVDIITQSTLWELKCVREITIDHLLQVIIYAWLYRHLFPNDIKDVKIFNIRTNEVLQLNATTEQLNFVVIHLLQGKYHSSEPLSDSDFVKQCRDMHQTYLQPVVSSEIQSATQSA